MQHHSVTVDMSLKDWANGSPNGSLGEAITREISVAEPESPLPLNQALRCSARVLRSGRDSIPLDERWDSVRI